MSRGGCFPPYTQTPHCLPQLRSGNGDGGKRCARGGADCNLGRAGRRTTNGVDVDEGSDVDGCRKRKQHCNNS